MIEKCSTPERISLSIWLVVNLFIGILIVQDFGVSFDEPRYYQYAVQSLNAYKSLFALFYEPDYGPANLRFYGPSYILFVELILRGLRILFTNVPTINIWHFSYFILFQFTGLYLYLLSKRWLNVWSAWFVMVMFISQPLLWGHAFINPKDIPFMAFFVFSIYSGLRMADSLGGHEPQVSLQTPLAEFGKAWNQMPVATRRKSLKLLVAGSTVFLTPILLNPLITKLVLYFYAADNDSIPGRIFRHFADQSSIVPVDQYIAFAHAIFSKLVSIILVSGLAAITAWIAYQLSKTDGYHELKSRWKELHRDRIIELITNVRNVFTAMFWHGTLAQIPGAFFSRKIITAGAILGLTISIRVLGPLPGLLLGIYIIWKNYRQAFAVLFAYFFWALLTTYITWPYLWISPISRYLESLTLMINFPWPGRVLFNGHFYRPDRLPSEYLPVLMNIQFTEPILILFYIGLLVFVRKLLVNRLAVDLLLFVILGFVLPFAAFIYLRIPLYDNFRQLLFLVPPIFVLAGYGFEHITDKLKRNYVCAALVILCAFPGMISIMQLHPYQYIYYNSLVGGVRGAERRYELDYWRTSYRELALRVNELASPSASIFVSGAPLSYLPYSRSDITVENKIDANRSYDLEYVVLTSRWNSDEYLFPDAKTIFVVERDGAVLSVLKQIKEKWQNGK